MEGCIQGTMSLISRCLGKGENIALVLTDVGVLLIEGTKVQMKFYYEFLEVLSGKENLQKVRVLFSPRPGQPHKGAVAMLALHPPVPLGLDLLANLLGWARAAVLLAPAALGSSRTECLGQAEDICHLHAPPLQVPQLMDMVVSRLEPVASLTFSGRVIIFPK